MFSEDERNKLLDLLQIEIDSLEGWCNPEESEHFKEHREIVKFNKDLQLKINRLVESTK